MRVLRVRAGDAIELFNGKGQAWRGEISGLARNEVRVLIQESRNTPRPAPRVTLALASLHRDKVWDDVVREATVLGAGRLCIFRAAHSEKPPRIHEKWERVAVEACKQCGCSWLPDFLVAPSLGAVLEGARGESIVIAAMEGPHRPFHTIPSDRDVTYVVGPEGDFSEMEYTQAREAGAVPISLGSHTLRSELAAQVGLTLIQHVLGRMG